MSYTIKLTRSDLYFIPFLRWIVEEEDLNRERLIELVAAPERWQPEFDKFMAWMAENKKLLCRQCMTSIKDGDYCPKCDLSGRGLSRVMIDIFEHECERSEARRIDEGTYL